MASETKLPERTVQFRFPKSPDFTDPEYDQRNPEHFFRAYDNRLRERYVAGAEMIELQEQIRHCALKSGVNSKEWCQELGLEYMRRLKCPNYVCAEVWLALLALCDLLPPSLRLVLALTDALPWPCGLFGIV